MQNIFPFPHCCNWERKWKELELEKLPFYQRTRPQILVHLGRSDVCIILANQQLHSDSCFHPSFCLGVLKTWLINAKKRSKTLWNLQINGSKVFAWKKNAFEHVFPNTSQAKIFSIRLFQRTIKINSCVLYLSNSFSTYSYFHEYFLLVKMCFPFFLPFLKVLLPKFLLLHFYGNPLVFTGF